MAEAQNLTQKLIKAHLEDGEMRPGEPIAIGIDQTLTQDATGTLVMLALEAMELDRVRTEVSVQYVDHNLIQADNKNPDDHLFLKSACERFGLWYSRPGNGVSHPVHMEYFGRPGKTMLGSDSHTPAAGALGMLAIGAGGVDVAAAMAGEPFRVRMPEVFGVRLTGALPDWVSAKDVILEMLRRHGVRGMIGKVVEYHGPGLSGLSAMDRHVIANMGTELGATSSVFPADDRVRDFLKIQGREDDYTEWRADEGADYDGTDEIDLSRLVPLIARPVSPGNVVEVGEVAGQGLYQAYLGSSANPGYRDLAIAAEMVRDRRIAPGVSFDINPASRQVLETLIRDSRLAALIHAGARLHQTGCNGCIGMGQAPASGKNSLRTVPRNFPGRSGTKEDCVFLCSPETATASALKGEITDPRDLAMDYPEVFEPGDPVRNDDLLQPPLSEEEAKRVELEKGPNVGDMPDLEPLPDTLTLCALLKAGDDISTDEILPGGTDVLPFRSNIEAISQFSFSGVDESYPERARGLGGKFDGHLVVGGENYGQGSSREHAALAPRHLGLRAVVARSFARIHRQNLINFGVVPLLFEDKEDYDRIETGDEVCLEGLKQAVSQRDRLEIAAGDRTIACRVELSARERDILKAGGAINYLSEHRL
ncbi:aconitate hydratase [Marinicauda algicola]|uniref:Aconitate hydratase n=1 Tax=Marinicauda algicola TaxID=2029849 RepID=A0A4S2H4Y3_9PROT|nr:aconitate hydratase [Marinicauda algicola]TGY90603.1 aconitate hydratase [Marinicauda algicola]